MRLIVAAVGRMKVGPEREILDRYLSRARTIARMAGVPAINLIEVEEGSARSAAERRREEGSALLARLAPGATLIALDERGPSLSSPAFAGRIARAIEAAAPAVVFAVGGPDGLDDAFRARADTLLAFGAATLPHQLARVVLAEQIYRAFTILNGHPYHRA